MARLNDPGKVRGVCLLGDYDPNHPRCAIIREGLSKQGIKVIECHPARHDLKQVREKKGNLNYVICLYKELWRQFRTADKDFTHVIVPHNNHLVAPLAYYFAKRYRKKFVIDSYDSIYYDASLKRGIRKGSLKSWRIFCAEKLALILADHILALTEGYKDYFASTFSLSKSKFSVFPVGVPANYFLDNGSKAQIARRKESSDFKVLYWGVFLPHHGLHVVVQAADMLRNYPNIKFCLVGDGMLRQQIRHQVSQLDLKNVCLPGYVSQETLINHIIEADVCLGVFSKDEKARISITNKVVQALAMKKPLITERSPITESVFTHKENAYLVPPEDAEALAHAVLELKEDIDLRLRLAQNGYKLYVSCFSEEALGKRLKTILEQV